MATKSTAAKWVPGATRMRGIVLFLVAVLTYLLGALLLNFHWGQNYLHLCLASPPAEEVVHANSSLIRVLSAVVVFPIAEECVFRVWLFGVFRRISLPQRVGASALLFALGHAQYWIDGIDANQLIWIFAFGIVLGSVYAVRIRVADSMAVHILVNALIVFPKWNLLPLDCLSASGRLGGFILASLLTSTVAAIALLVRVLWQMRSAPNALPLAAEEVGRGR